MPGRDTRIIVSGSQEDEDGNILETDYEAEGQYYEKDGCRYLLYREEDADSGTVTSNTLKIMDGSLELVRRGAVTSRMTFKPGQSYPADYITLYGSLQLSVSTLDLACFWTDSGGQIRLTYSLLAEGVLLSRNQLTVKFFHQNLKNFPDFADKNNIRI